MTTGRSDCGKLAEVCKIVGAGARAGKGAEFAVTTPPDGAIRAAIGSGACGPVPKDGFGAHAVFVGTFGFALNPLDAGTVIDDLVSADFFSWLELPDGERQPLRPASNNMLPAIRFIDISPVPARAGWLLRLDDGPKRACRSPPGQPLWPPELPRTGIPRCPTATLREA